MTVIDRDSGVLSSMKHVLDRNQKFRGIVIFVPESICFQRLSFVAAV